MNESITHRGHRGLHPQDARLFLDEGQVVILRAAARDLAWLQERGYAADAALKLVGDHYRLRKRQRMALLRGVCPPQKATERQSRRVDPEALRGRSLWVDGLNQIITVEVAFSGGILLRGMDSALRDLASVHGTYRLVSETPRAIEALGSWLSPRGLASVTLLIDAPVSNSGRLADLIRRIAAANGWAWTVELAHPVDFLLKRSGDVIASSDAAVLDAKVSWIDLAGKVVADHVDAPRVLQIIAPGDAP